MRPPEGDETTERLGDSSGAHAAASAPGEDIPISGQPGAHLADRTAHRSVTLDINATEDDLHTLQLALHGLREIVRPGPLRIELRVSATKPDGEIEAGAFQNRVRQHLEADEDVRFEERRE